MPGKKSPHGKIGLAAATLAVCFITALNTNEAFAATAGRLPVIGAVSRVLTFRNYDTADEEKEIHMEIPQIQEPEAGSTSSPLAADVNKEIETIMAAYRRDAQQRIEEQLCIRDRIAHQQRPQIMGTMTGGIAHEFNNLLTPIMGYADLMMMELPERCV